MMESSRNSRYLQICLFGARQSPTYPQSLREAQTQSMKTQAATVLASLGEILSALRHLATYA